MEITRIMSLGTAGLLAAVLVGPAACGGADDGDGRTAPGSTGPTATTSSSGSAPEPTAAADAELFEFEITGGEASPPLERASVARGATVRIVVASDQPDEIHLHGYELAAEVGPGQPGVIEFVADQAGLFELETHETGLVLLQLQVQ
jgi:hypothetical protein